MSPDLSPVSHKERIRRFLREAVHAGSPEALDRYCATGYLPHTARLSHSPTLAPGLDALRKRMAVNGPLPNCAYRLVADGDFVFAQVQYAGARPTAGADIFRFDADGLIAEHWNIRQENHEEIQLGHDRYLGAGDPDTPVGERQRALLKERVTGLFQEAWSQGRAELVTSYYADDYIQHNRHIASGSARIRQIIATRIAQFIVREQRAYPITIHRLGSEGDLVYAHCSIYMAGLTDDKEGDRSETVDIFRVGTDLRMAEHWDVLQTESDRFANDLSFY